MTLSASTKTVQRAIDNSTLSNDKVEPTKVIGKDGKAIAAADGTVSRQTVMRAIDEPVCPNGQTEPTKVIGKGYVHV